MAKKIMSKHIVIMTDLVILILIGVQANDLTPTSLHSSSLRLPSTIDNVQGPFYICLESSVQDCIKDQQKLSTLRAKCISKAYRDCFRSHMEFKDDPIYKKAVKAYESCLKRHKGFFYRGECLHTWYKNYIKKH